MKLSAIACFLLFPFLITVSMIIGSGCAQIGAPTGGKKDTIPPRLLYASPKAGTTNFSGNKIVLTFNEYVDVQDVQNNVLVSPLPVAFPQINFKLKTVTVRLRDTLRPNTTYSINFGNAIKDNNEGNPLKQFTYVFSTGPVIDSLELTGKVTLAETGKTDSTLIAMLYRDAVDTTVQNKKPDYIAKVNGEGEFTFTNLPAGNFKLYALKDGDGSKTYNSAIETFAFLDEDVVVSENTAPVLLNAYAEEKDKKDKKAVVKPAKEDKKFKYQTNLNQNSQDILNELTIEFTHTLKDFIPEKIQLTDTSNNLIQSVKMTLDSARKKVTIKTPWKEDNNYRLVIDKDAVSDSVNSQLFKTDTISFKTKKTSEYGSILLRFKNADFSKHLVLQFVQGDEVLRAVPITTTQWSDKLFPPGEYELRILYDDNNNGIWDTGNYLNKLQPEKAFTLDKKLTIKANWDNERDIELGSKNKL